MIVKHIGKIRYRGRKYCLAYADFKGLISYIGKRKGIFYIFISSCLTPKDKSKEIHRLLKDKKKFEHKGRRNIPLWLK